MREVSAIRGRTLILQTPSTAETAAVRQAAFLADSGAYAVRNAAIESLGDHATSLKQGALPVGSVEFVRAAMEIASIREPANLTYPDPIRPWLRRDVRTVRLDEVRDRTFIKPTSTKLFTGFIFDPTAAPDPSREHDLEQDRIVRGLPGSTLVHASPVVGFQCEWRYYVQGGNILGGARYDDAGADEAPEPDMGTLRECVLAMGQHRPFALDAGVLPDGRTALVEINDGWAIGLYRGAITPAQYLGFLLDCWDSLREDRS